MSEGQDIVEIMEISGNTISGGELASFFPGLAQDSVPKDRYVGEFLNGLKHTKFDVMLKPLNFQIFLGVEGALFIRDIYNKIRNWQDRQAIIKYFNEPDGEVQKKQELAKIGVLFAKKASAGKLDGPEEAFLDLYTRAGFTEGDLGHFASGSLSLLGRAAGGVGSGIIAAGMSALMIGAAVIAPAYFFAAAFSFSVLGHLKDAYHAGKALRTEEYYQKPLIKRCWDDVKNTWKAGKSSLFKAGLTALAGSGVVVGLIYAAPIIGTALLLGAAVILTGFTIHFAVSKGRAWYKKHKAKRADAEPATTDKPSFWKRFKKAITPRKVANVADIHKAVTVAKPENDTREAVVAEPVSADKSDKQESADILSQTQQYGSFWKRAVANKTLTPAERVACRIARR